MFDKQRLLTILLALFALFGVILFLRPARIFSNVAAVETGESIGAFRDVNCTVMVTSIDWGNMTIGQTRTITFYVKNQDSTNIFLYAIDKNWNPVTAQYYIDFIFDSNDQEIQPNMVRKVAFNLSISPRISGIANYSFDVLLLGTDHLLADVTQDGRVDMKDVAYVARVFNTTPSSIDWNPEADLNRDLRVNMIDVAIVCKDFQHRALMS